MRARYNFPLVAWLSLFFLCLSPLETPAFGAKTTQGCDILLLGLKDPHQFAESLQRATQATLNLRGTNLTNKMVSLQVPKEFQTYLDDMSAASDLERNTLLQLMTAATEVLREQVGFLKPVSSGIVEEKGLPGLQKELRDRMMNQREFQKGEVDFSAMIPTLSMSVLKSIAKKAGRTPAEMTSILFEFADELLEAGGVEAETLIASIKLNVEYKDHSGKVPIRRVVPRALKVRIEKLRKEIGFSNPDYLVTLIDFGLEAWLSFGGAGQVFR